MKDDASYVCDSCGEEIVVPIDLSAGSQQEYVEDCPVCCCPNIGTVLVGHGVFRFDQRRSIVDLRSSQAAGLAKT